MRDAPLLRVLHDLERVRVLEQRLGRNAAPQQAGAAERLLLLDDGDLQAELRGADGRDVAAGAGADHDRRRIRWPWSRHGRRHAAYRFSDDSGTNVVAAGAAPARGGGAGGSLRPGSSRVDARRNWPCS